MPSRRQERVQGRIVEEVAAALRALKDPRLGFVTVTEAEVSPDLRHANVYVSILGDDEAQKASMEVLEKAAGRLRPLVGRRLGLKATPALRFVHDRSREKLDTMSRLIEEARATDPHPGAASDEEAPDPPTEE